MILNRFLHRDDATLGTLTVGSKTFFTLELPWKKNKRSVSCIPCGSYCFAPHGWEDNTPLHFKKVWGLKNVPNRSSILIHSGNYNKDTDGCILVGTGCVIKENMCMVTHSRDAIEYIRKYITYGIITIKD